MDSTKTWQAEIRKIGDAAPTIYSGFKVFQIKDGFLQMTWSGGLEMGVATAGIAEYQITKVDE